MSAMRTVQLDEDLGPIHWGNQLHIHTHTHMLAIRTGKEKVVDSCKSDKQCGLKIIHFIYLYLPVYSLYGLAN